MTRFFFRLLNYFLLACFLGTIWGGWYVSKNGFGRKWRKKLSEEFAKRGVELTARRLTLDPLRGVVAHGVQVFRDSSHDETVAVIDELRLDINYTRLLRKEPFLDALLLSEAEVKLDIDPRRKNLGEFTIRHLAAQLYFQQDQLEIRRLKGEGLGIDFNITGIVGHRADWQAAANPGNVLQPLKSIPRNWLKNLSEIKFPEGKPGRLDLRFQGDLTQKQWLQTAQGRLQLPELRWRGVQVADLNLEADYARKWLTLRQLKWRDAHGHAEVSGSWQPGLQGNLLVDSQADAIAIFRELHWLPALSAVEALHLQGDVSWTEARDFDWKIIGKLDARKLVYRDGRWDRGQAQFSITPSRWFLNDAVFRQKEGAVSGQLLHDRGRVAAEIRSTVDPRALWQSAGNAPLPWMKELSFGANPLLKLRVNSLPETPATLQTTGSIVFGRTNFRGVAFTSAQADFSALNGGLALNEVQITRPEGQLIGEAFWNAAAGELTVWEVKNSIDVVALGLWLDGPLGEIAETVSLPKGTTTEGKGRFVWRENQLAALQLDVSSEAFPLFELPLLKSLSKNFAERARFRLQATAALGDHTLRIALFDAEDNRQTLTGEANWDFSTQRFSGSLREAGGSWKADSPWQKIVWSRP